ncbi:LOW QUALITY PROTEIN: hypothetical protein HID58_095627, partial [Brassica napus]
GGLNDYSFAGTRSQNLVDRDPIKTSFEEWANPGHFSRTKLRDLILPLGSGTYMLMLTILIVIPVIWRKSLENAHFGQLSIIFLWLSGMYFHGARGVANSGPRKSEWRCGRRLPRNTNNLWLFQLWRASGI